MFKILKAKWFLSVMILVIGWLTLSFTKIKLHEDIVNKEVHDLEAKMENLEKSNGIIEKFISYMSDPAFLEKQARIKLNYKAPDEEVVFVYTDNSAKMSSSSKDIDQNSPNYLKWWRYIKD